MLEADLLRHGVAARSITAAYSEGFRDGGWLKIENVTSPLEVRISVPEDGNYRIKIKPVSQVLEAPMRIGFKGGAMQTIEKQSGH
jgi:hypothetical protein